MTTPYPREALSKALEQRRLLRELSEHSGFLSLNDLVQEQVDALQQDILFSPCSGIDSAWVQEYKKGQLEGRLVWGKVLETALENCEIDIQHFRSQIDDDGLESDDNGNSNSAP